MCTTHRRDGFCSGMAVAPVRASGCRASLASRVHGDFSACVLPSAVKLSKVHMGKGWYGVQGVGVGGT